LAAPSLTDTRSPFPTANSPKNQLIYSQQNMGLPIHNTTFNYPTADAIASLAAINATCSSYMY